MDEQKHAVTARRVEIFVRGTSGPARLESRILLGSKVALIVYSLAPDATLIVLAIGRNARRGAVLAGGIVLGCGRRAGLRAGCLGGFGARFALG